MGLEPLHWHLPRLLCVLVPWGVVVGLRPVCLVAQRVPLLVLLVRVVRRRLDGARAARVSR